MDHIVWPHTKSRKPTYTDLSSFSGSTERLEHEEQGLHKVHQ